MTVLVLDDDPTGTQCASGVPVLLRPAGPLTLPVGRTSAYVLTNTRALAAADAAALISGIRERAGPGTELVLRGDSTLRGHVFTEMAALGLAEGAGLIVPAFPAAGRVTIGGVHWLATGAQRVNMADTEFARDPVFGFTARTMRDWVTELGGVRPYASVAATGVREALLRVPNGGVVVPDVATDADLAPIVAGLAAAREAGRHVVVRCAAPLAALLAGVEARLVPRPPERRAGLLIVCGSHTTAATAQLAALAGRTPPHLVLNTDAVLGPDAAQAVDDVVEAARAELAQAGVAVVTTERQRRPEHGRLADGAVVMAALMAVVRRLVPYAGAIVTKGGITSAEVAATGLGAAVATVLGQVETGVPLWDVAGVPVAVVPGNIGDDGTLTRMLDYFTGG